MKTFGKIMCVVLVLALLGGGVAALYHFTDGFKKWSPDSTFTNKNGEQLSASKVYALQDIVATSDVKGDSITMQAVIEPINAFNKNLTWELRWKNAESSFAKGKAVTDYVSIQVEQKDSTKVTVKCLKAFGEQIILKATAVANKNATAEANIDYRKRLTGISSITVNNYEKIEEQKIDERQIELIDKNPTLQFKQLNSLPYSYLSNFEVTTSKSVGTLEPNYKKQEVKLKWSEEFFDNAKQYLTSIGVNTSLMFNVGVPLSSLENELSLYHLLVLFDITKVANPLPEEMYDITLEEMTNFFYNVITQSLHATEQQLIVEVTYEDDYSTINESYPVTLNFDSFIEIWQNVINNITLPNQNIVF